MDATLQEILELIRGGKTEEAFFALIEMPGDVLPSIIAVFRHEPSADVRALLVKAGWERREDAVLPFLADALRDEAEDVWQQALDGLVALASVQTLRILENARGRAFPSEDIAKRFRLWLEEAIQQVQIELRSKGE